MHACVVNTAGVQRLVRILQQHRRRRKDGLSAQPRAPRAARVPPSRPPRGQTCRGTHVRTRGRGRPGQRGARLSHLITYTAAVGHLRRHPVRVPGMRTGAQSCGRQGAIVQRLYSDEPSAALGWRACERAFARRNGVLRDGAGRWRSGELRGGPRARHHAQSHVLERVVAEGLQPLPPHGQRRRPGPGRRRGGRQDAGCGGQQRTGSEQQAPRTRHGGGRVSGGDQ